MELHPFDRQAPVAQSHHDALTGPGGHFQTVGNTARVHDEGVVAGRLEHLRQASEHAATVVAYRGRLAVHDLGARTICPPKT